MKKLLAILASLALLSVVSCDEKDGAASSNQLPDELSEINVASSCPLLKDAGRVGRRGVDCLAEKRPRSFT